MTYPNSSAVSAGQPTASSHYNNLRLDALNLGQADADVVKLAAFLQRFHSGIKIEELATNRLRVPFVSTDPPTLMINGFMLQAAANVDLAAGSFSGSAATWYIFAVRTTGSTTFTLAVNTSATESTDQRLIGQVYWNGSNISSIICLFTDSYLPVADYDSGWFACSISTTYTLSHELASTPRLVLVYHANDSLGTSEWIPVFVVQSSSAYWNQIWGVTGSQIILTTGSLSGYGTVTSTRRQSGSGYYRVFAWL